MNLKNNQTEQFNVFQKYIIQKAKEHEACTTEFKRAVNSTDFKELLQVIKDNSNWCYNNNVIDGEILLKYVDDKILTENNIFVNKTDVIQKDGFALYFGSSTSEHFNSSTSKHYDSSTSKHFNSSTSEHYDSSTSKHFNSSTSKHFGSSTSKHFNSSYASVYKYNADLHLMNDKSIIRERSTGEIYILKNSIKVNEI